MSTRASSAPRSGNIAETLEPRVVPMPESSRDGTAAHGRGWLVRRTLLVADVVGLVLAFVSAELLFGYESGLVDRVEQRLELLLFAITLPGWIVVAKLYGLYDRDERRADCTTADDIAPVFHMVTVGAWLFFVGAWVSDLAQPNFAKLATFWALAIVLVSLGRAAARAFCRRRSAFRQNTIIVGADDVGLLVARKLLKHPEYGLTLVGFVDVAEKEIPSDLRRVAVLGPPGELPALVRAFGVERVVIAFSDESFERTLALVRLLVDLDVRVDIVPRLFEVVGQSVGIHTIEGLALVGLPSPRLSRSSRLLKRTADLVYSVFGLLILAPIFIPIAMAIKLESPGPVFFRQLRVGFGETTFRIFKFRTMGVDADERKSEFVHLNMHERGDAERRMFKIERDPRVTRVGRLLRRYSLDELPQLINVLRGEMSFVGPRPLILDEHRHVDGWERKRLALKPGMTGLWQVLGRSDISFDEMLKLDYLYVTEWSLFTDLKLVLRTLPEIVRPRHAY